jgi:predicted amidophosphoribosyltransferase
MHDNWYALLLEILFAPRCPGCRRALPYAQLLADPGRTDPWCAHCGPQVRGVGESCPACAQPHLGWLDAPSATGLCQPCKQSPPPWGWAACALEMSGPARAAALACKSPGGAWACHVMGRHLSARISATERLRGARIVPVPLHASTRNRRGFNQAQELARAVAGATGATVEMALERPKLGLPQKRLRRAQRPGNVHGAFRATDRARHLVGEPVVLLDDIITTTSTLRAAAQALSDVGVEVAGVVGLCREP